MRTKLQVISGPMRGRNLKIPAGARPTQARARGAVMNMLGSLVGRNFPAPACGGGTDFVSERSELTKSWVGAGERSAPTQELLGGKPPSNSIPPPQAGAGKVVWDAFAGSGALGIEFVSRFGAARAVFTDTDPDAIAAIRENTAGLDAEVVIKQVSALNYCPPAADGVFYQKIPHQAAPANQVVIFIDPPYSDFAAGEKLVEKLGASAAPGTIVVWEMEKTASPAPACGGGIDFVGEHSEPTKSWVGDHLGKQNCSSAREEDLPPPKNIYEKSPCDFSRCSIPPPQAGAGKSHFTLLRDRTHGRARFLILRKI
ncbi:MAG: RsmD family RNA methyltransferase [Rickettsiales bacterium]|jgi:16S rRNA G966 N2-methylase RsmD|nr:RsmD family RNA methyltransferase [Rickettsiales bacterium]